MAFTARLGIQPQVLMPTRQAVYLLGYLASLILEFWRQDTRGGKKNPEGSRGSSALPGA